MSPLQIEILLAIHWGPCTKTELATMFSNSQAYKEAISGFLNLDNLIERFPPTDGWKLTPRGTIYVETLLATELPKAALVDATGKVTLLEDK